MGTEMVTVYGSIAGSVTETAAKLQYLFENEFTGHIKKYSGKVRLDEETGWYESYEEAPDLLDKEDLNQRLLELGAGTFYYELDLGFAPTVAQVMLFPDRGTTTAVISFEKELASYVFTSEVTHEPYASVLERIARSIDAACYISGGDYERWCALRPSELADPEVYKMSPVVVGWREGTVDTAAVLKTLGAKPEWLEKTLYGYNYLLLFGRYNERIQRLKEGA